MEDYKFKVGDRVDTPYGLGTVWNIDQYNMTCVEHDDWSDGHGGAGKGKFGDGTTNKWFYCNSSLTLVQPKVGSYVQVIHDSWGKGLTEAIGKVVANVHIWISVEFEDWIDGHGPKNNKWNFWKPEDELRVVSGPPKPYQADPAIKVKPVNPFKPGDTVRLKRNRGCTYVIAKLGNPHRPQFGEDVSVTYKDDAGWDMVENIELVSRPTVTPTEKSPVRTYIVVTMHKDGTLSPASCPVKHSSREAAEAEALRLAKTAHPSASFLVFEAVAQAIPPVAPAPILVTL